MPTDDPACLVEVGEATIPSRLDAPSRARGLVAGWLNGSAHAELQTDACLLVSELVTNSVRHAAQPAGAALRVTAATLDGRLRVEVHDHGHGPVRPRTPGAGKGGFGLHLVQLIAERWGVDHEHGTRVWFELSTHNGRSPGAGQPRAEPAS